MGGVGGGHMTRMIAVVLLFAGATVAGALGVANQANFNDGKPGSAMQCQTFDNDPQGTKCAEFCRRMKEADPDGQTYCMCLPGPCPKQ